MGLDLEFAKGEGPVIHNPIRSAADVDKLGVADPIEDTGYVMEAIKILRGELENKVPLIGFAGAPFTLASYMIEGRRHARLRATPRRLMWDEPERVGQAHEQVTADTVIAYLQAQIDAGAQAVQVFDSWVGFVAPRDYELYVLPHTHARHRGGQGARRQGDR